MYTYHGTPLYIHHGTPTLPPWVYLILQHPTQPRVYIPVLRLAVRKECLGSNPGLIGKRGRTLRNMPPSLP